MIRRDLLLALSAAALALSACGKPAEKADAGAAPTELTFSILSAENQTSMEPLWAPLLTDMSEQIGVRVKPYFATNYTSLVEAMRFKQVQMGWFSASPALQAVNRADAEVLGRVVDAGGDATYKSVIIVKKGSGITLDKLLKCDKTLNFGLGDTQSTSGTLAPMAYLFTPKGIEPSKCFKSVRSASHQANAFSVANGVLDVATNNTVGIVFFKRQSPDMADKIEVIWTSPPLPESSIVVRKDLDPALKEKIRQFFLTYGTGTDEKAAKQREVLKGLAYGGFKPADNSYLDPVREMEAAEDLAAARRGGDKAKIAAAQADFAKIQAQAAQARAIEPAPAQ
ncbi:MAG: phosphate/phosphite/phosphonate ABC transporter substrate-binding protein [Alphaproteobacteria bacterium]|nr:phosphate/phosphite/phosphonate ABC transporter substrate-binding protein [Alphaproteobacteria bacterium]MBU1514201.1 phosphate/phosphite/phosphonate ABC transporter substrate-binding protein [Alphaproteobacteria bacterium]MBU2096150.1 phosphate/phosphite/phosphonate ABC transporter substrate-binding protein [Alphaproteobacteria bacterium]MBU2151104.1 phosphate/phosphite/phosphonate ABC transporter substrate-binding protein [Alphaproteobacteria bacterium]MBU2307237.1 phosphate/phosphite/phos